jgi:hypothetical protein
MNVGQKIVLIAAATALVFALLFPPFAFQYVAGADAINQGFAFIFDPPLIEEEYRARVDTTLLGLECLIVAVVGGLLFAVFGHLTLDDLRWKLVREHREDSNCAQLPQELPECSVSFASREPTCNSSLTTAASRDAKGTLAKSLAGAIIVLVVFGIAASVLLTPQQARWFYGIVVAAGVLWALVGPERRT